MQAKYVKSVVRYSDGSVNVWIDYNNQEHWLVDKALQNLADQINNLYLGIIGRPAEKDGMMYYYRIYESECRARGIPFTPDTTVDADIMNDVMRPLITYNYKNNDEAAMGAINYVGKYCAAKSAGII